MATNNQSSSFNAGNQRSAAVVSGAEASEAVAQATKFQSKTLDDIFSDMDEQTQLIPDATEIPPIVQPKPTQVEAVETPDPEPANPFKSSFVPADILSGKSEPAEVAEEDEQAEPVAAESTEDMPPEDIAGDPKKANAWSRIKSEKKQLKLELESLKKQLAEKADTDYLSRIEALEQEKQEIEDKLGRYNITEMSSFKQQYDLPLQQKFGRAVQLLTKKGIEEKTAQKLAVQALNPEVDRSELFGELDYMTQSTLATLYTGMDELNAARETAISSWRDTKAVLAEQEARQGMANLSNNIVANTTKAVEALRTEGNYLFMLSQENEDWNKGVQERIRSIQGILKTGSNEDLVKYVAEGVTARVYRDYYEKERQRADKLAAELAKRNKLRPAVGATGRSDASAEPVAPKKPLSMNGRLDSIFGEGM